MRISCCDLVVSSLYDYYYYSWWLHWPECFLYIGNGTVTAFPHTVIHNCAAYNAWLCMILFIMWSCMIVFMICYHAWLYLWFMVMHECIYNLLSIMKDYVYNVWSCLVVSIMSGHSGLCLQFILKDCVNNWWSCW